MPIFRASHHLYSPVLTRASLQERPGLSVSRGVVHDAKLPTRVQLLLHLQNRTPEPLQIRIINRQQNRNERGIMKLCDLLPNAFHVLSLELIVASDPARIITGVPIRWISENRAAYRMNEKGLPRAVAAARFHYEFAAPRGNDGLEGKAASQRT